MTTMVIAMPDETVDSAGLMRLMMWLSPSFPVGSYSYSHGIEYAVECGRILDRESAVSWIGAVMNHGAGRSDSALFLEVHRAVLAGDRARVRAVGELAASFRPSTEIGLESAAQGSAFVRALRVAWPDPAALDWASALGPEPAYAVAVGVAAAAAGIGEGPALSAYLHAMAANLVSAVVRLVPLGQSDGLRALAALHDRMPELTALARRRPFHDIGSATLTVDWTSMRHETQYTRLFRS